MRSLLLILSACLLTGCASVKVNNILEDVESYIFERPDSALAVLESFDRSDLRSRRSEAHHALLHAMALDKNYIDVTDDSLASVAVRYYRKHGPKKNLARSLYYKGLSYYYNKEYDKSIIELSKAEPVAAVYDSLYLGFVKMLQASIYDINYNDIEELCCLERALEIYKATGVEYYITVAELELAQSYISNEQYKTAEILLEDILHSGQLNNYLAANINGEYAFLMATRPDADYNAAVTYFEKTAEVEKGRYLSKQDYWVWAYSLVRIGDIDKAKKIVDMLSPTDTSGTAYYWQYAIAKSQGKTSEALDYFEKFSDRNNDEVVQILRQSISSVQRDFFQSQNEIADYKLKVRGFVLSGVIVSFVFIIVIIVFSAVRYRRRKEEEKVYYIRYAEEVSRQLEEFKCGAYSDLQKKYIALHKSKYETLQTLFEKYMQSDGRVDAEKLIYKKVVSLIDDLRNDIEKTSKFEKYLDLELGEIMKQLHAEFPKLNERYYMLFGYLALGFRYPVISHFMGCSENAIRIIKNRLKSTIKNSDAKHKSEFLEVIG